MAEERYYCLRHTVVERQGECRVDERLGPYASYAEAERALEKVANRNDTWDDDPAWNDPD